MSSGSSYFLSPDGSYSREDNEQSSFQQRSELMSNPTDSSFDPEESEWDGWMKWDNTTIDNNPPLALQNNQFSTEHSSTSVSPWSQDNNIEPQFEPFFNQMAIEDTAFEPFKPTTGRDFDQNFDTEIGSSDLSPETRPRRRYYGYSTLTVLEEQELQEIAMPSRKMSQTSGPSQTESSPFSSLPHTPLGDETTQTSKKKRKSLSKSNDTEPGEIVQSRKRGHNAIEKRYRTNLNDKIVLLRQSIPSLYNSPDGGQVDDEDDEDEDDSERVTKSTEKYGKAAILTRAVEYIGHLEGSTKRLGNEANALRARVNAFEKLAMSGSMPMSSNESSRVQEQESLETVKSEFQQSSRVKDEKIKAESKVPKRRSSK